MDPISRKKFPFLKAQNSTQLIIFDLDGTLVDSAPDIAAAINCMYRELGYPEKSLDHIKQWVGNGSAMLVKRSLAEATGGVVENITTDIFQPAHELFFKHYRRTNGQHTTLFPGVRDTLQHFKQAGVQQAICTNKPAEFTHNLLKKLSLDNFFACVVSGDTLPVKKPDPAPLLFCAETYKVAVTQCLMVGDSVTDVKAAKNANIPVVCVSYGYHRDDNLAQQCTVINNLSELLWQQPG